MGPRSTLEIEPARLAEESGIRRERKQSLHNSHIFGLGNGVDGCVIYQDR